MYKRQGESTPLKEFGTAEPFGIHGYVAGFGSDDLNHRHNIPTMSAIVNFADRLMGIAGFPKVDLLFCGKQVSHLHIVSLDRSTGQVILASFATRMIRQGYTKVDGEWVRSKSAPGLASPSEKVVPPSTMQNIHCTSLRG